MKLRMNNTMNTWISESVEKKKPYMWIKLLAIVIICVVIFNIFANKVVENTISAQSSILLSVVGLMSIVTIMVGVFIYFLSIEKRKIEIFGFTKKNIFKNYFVGLIMGLIAVSLITFIAIFSGWIDVYKMPDINILGIVIMFVAFIFQGMSEEIVFRAVLMPRIAKKYGVLASIIITSIIFGVAHTANPNASPLGMINTILFGGVFAVIYYYFDNIWVCSAFHTIWNYFLSVVVGIEMSGMKASISIFSGMSNPSVNSILSGGAYGLEASILTTIAAVVLIIVFTRLSVKKYRKI